MKNLKDISQADFVALCREIGCHPAFWEGEFENVKIKKSRTTMKELEYTIFFDENKQKGAYYLITLWFSEDWIRYCMDITRFGVDDGFMEEEHHPWKNLSLRELRYLRDLGYNVYL